MSDILRLNNRQKELYLKIYNNLSNVLKEFYIQHKDKKFALLLSGGYDSRFVLYLCKELNIPISCCYTFSLEDRLSTDAKLASRVCAIENVKCKIVKLPINSDEIIKLMETLARDYDCTSKTDFECTFPLYYLYKEIDEDIILSGTDADCYFGVGKKYALHYKNIENGLAKFRYDMFNGNSNGQIHQRHLLCETFNKLQFDPFYPQVIRDTFENTTWEELNIPYKKGPLYVPFIDKYKQIKIYRSSYQCGDSGIRELCENILMKSCYNTKNFKSVVGCYNEIVRSVENDRNTTKLF